MRLGGAQAGSQLGKNLVIAASLLAAGFLVAWLRFRPHLASQSVFSDGAHRYEGLATLPIRYAVWDQVEPLPFEAPDEEPAHRPTLSADGRWLVFAGGERGLGADLWIAEMIEGVAREVRPLFELNTSFDEVSPAFGEGWLWFASNRPGGEGGFDLWRAPFADGVLGEAVSLGAGINGRKDEVDPAPLPGSDALAFASNRETAGRRGHDLYLARPGAPESWTVEPLVALNSQGDEREPAFTADGRRLVFASDRGGVRGSFDLLESLSDRGAWLPPRALAGLNGTASERGPSPIGDGFSLLFEVEREGAPAGLFRARSLELFPHPGPVVGWLERLLLFTLLLLALLAWLAKRRGTIEVLYKCFLVSAIAHGLLLWWFRGIHPEAELEPLPEGRAAVYHVRLADGAAAHGGTRERGGVLEVEAKLARGELAVPELRVRGEVPREAVRVAEAREIAREAPAEAPLPERETTERLEPERGAAVPATALHEGETSWERLRGEAPELVLAAREGSPARSESPEPASALRGWQGALPRVAAVAPEGPQGTRSERAELDALPERRGGTVRPERPEEGSPGPVARLEGPRERFEPLGGEVAELALPAPSAVEKTAVETTARERARVAESPQRWEVPGAGEASPDSQGLTPPERSMKVAQFAEGPLPVERASEPSGPQEVALPSGEVRVPEAAEVVVVEGEASAPLEIPALAPLAATPAPHPRAIDGALAAPARFRSTEARSEAAPPMREIEADTRLAAVEEELGPARRFEHTPYRARFGPAKARAIEELGGGVETEAAVAAGLAYLAGRQHEEGHWGTPDRCDDKYGYVLVGKTGLALLAFLGAGHTQESGTEYSPVVERAIELLLAVQGEDSGHFGSTSAYSHGIATYALAETYALTGDERLEEPLRAAIAQIARHQNRRERDPRRFGGWSYYYPDERVYDSWPRVSVTVWQVMALESATLGGLEVPARALDDARTFLLAALDEERGCFRYNHDPSRLDSSYPILPGSTPAALFALSLLGEDLTEGRYIDPVGFLMEREPGGYEYRGDGEFVRQATGNLYFWYYGSLAMLRHGGNEWARWNESLKETLLPAQRADGSWEPLSVYAEYAGDSSRDAVYTTALCVLSLEVYYRYFTPLLKGRQ